jgi:hypothetical protein
MIGRGGLILLDIYIKKEGRWLVEDQGCKGHLEMVFLRKISAQGGAGASNIYVGCAYSKHNVTKISHRGPRCVNNKSWY